MHRFKSQIGIDIQSTDIGFLQLSYTKKACCIAQAETIHLPPGAVVDGRIQQFDIIMGLLQSLVSKTKTKRCRTAISLPMQCVITKKVSLPPEQSDADIRSLIARNLQEYFPDVTDELVYDYIPLNEDNRLKKTVLVVAARYDHLISYVGVVEQAGLNVTRVDVDLYALIRGIRFGCPENTEKQLLALWNTNHDMTQWIMVQHNEILFYQEYSNKTKDLFAQIKRALPLFFSHHPFPIKQIIRCGSIQDSPDITTYLFETFHLETTYIHPFESLNVSSTISDRALLTHRLIVCLGLALRT